MIANGDCAARNAFRVGLLTPPHDTPLPINLTQELDPSDILEVRDMAAAIALAEQIVAAPRSSRSVVRDMFESLGRAPTDDTAGPATPAPASVASIAPIALFIPAAEDDAYLQPGGRIRGFADVTLDGYRPEPTLLVRARVRRKRFAWMLVMVLLPLGVLAGNAFLGQEADATASSSRTPAAAGARTATAGKTPLAKPTMTTKKKSLTVSSSDSDLVTAVPVFDVNSLPAARPRK